ncbi:MAG: hypothetical protein H0U92_02925 [Actinobacteria bacterium]|nr:hypothetical protein [Actinomycetota bacterium]
MLLATTLRDVHVAWAWVTIGSNGLAGLWALGAHRYPQLRTRALWWFTAAAQVAMFIQVGLGVAMVSGQRIDPPQFHMFYGFIAIIVIGMSYSYRQQLQKVYLWYGLFGLFIMGLGIRAVLVGTAR